MARQFPPPPSGKRVVVAPPREKDKDTPEIIAAVNADGTIAIDDEIVEEGLNGFGVRLREKVAAIRQSTPKEPLLVIQPNGVSSDLLSEIYWKAFEEAGVIDIDIEG